MVDWAENTKLLTYLSSCDRTSKSSYQLTHQLTNLSPSISAARPAQNRIHFWFGQPRRDICRIFWTRALRNGGQSSGAVWKSRWTSWAPVPNKPTVSVDGKQHSTNNIIMCVDRPWPYVSFPAVFRVPFSSVAHLSVDWSDRIGRFRRGC